MRFRTIDQKPNGDEFAKASELIEIRGTGTLSLQVRDAPLPSSRDPFSENGDVTKL